MCLGTFLLRSFTCSFLFVCFLNFERAVLLDGQCDGVKTRKCQLWFKRFGDGDCDPSDKRRPERRTTLYDDILKGTAESDPH